MKFLVAGLGSMGKRRIRNLKALGMDSIAGFDIRADRRAECVEKYQVPAYEDFSEAMATQPDALVISLPPDLHAQFAMAAIRAGKSFFTEVNVTLDGMEEMVRAMKASGVVGFPSCTMRFFPGPRRVKELLTAGAIGEPLAWVYHCGQYLPDWHPWESIQDFYAGVRETGGCREIVSFELGWLINLFGECSSVSAQVAKVSSLPADIDDVYQLLMRHENGVLGSLTVDVLARPAVRHMRVLGTRGTIEWDNARKLLILSAADPASSVEQSLTGASEDGCAGPEQPYIEEMRTFVGCVRDRKIPAYTFEDDQRNLRLLYAAELSSRTGRRIFKESF
jgi:predicted dehydrogenase